MLHCLVTYFCDNSSVFSFIHLSTLKSIREY